MNQFPLNRELSPNTTSFFSATDFLYRNRRNLSSPVEEYVNPHYTNAIKQNPNPNEETNESDLLSFSSSHRFRRKPLLPTLDTLLEKMRLLDEEWLALSRAREAQSQKIQIEKAEALEQITTIHTGRILDLYSAEMDGRTRVDSVKAESTLFSQQLERIINRAETDKQLMCQHFSTQEQVLMQNRSSLESRIQERIAFDKREALSPLRAQIPDPDPTLTSQDDTGNFVRIIQSLYDRRFLPQSMPDDQKILLGQSIQKFVDMNRDGLVTFFVTDPSNIPSDIDPLNMERLHKQGCAFLGTSQNFHIQTPLFAFFSDKLLNAVYLPDILDTQEGSDFFAIKIEMQNLLIIIAKEMGIAIEAFNQLK